MEKYLPFYMIYQKDTVWDDERMLQKDYEYMKCTYPDTAKRVMPFVEEECDRLEYSGSMMFDEYPDQLQLWMMCKRIYDKVRGMEGRSERWLFEMVQVLTCQEILKRRSEYRKYRKKLY